MKKDDLVELFRFVFLPLFGGVAFWLVIIFCIPAYIRNIDEKDCVEFYKENGYVLDSCEKWKNKLENID